MKTKLFTLIVAFLVLSANAFSQINLIDVAGKGVESVKKKKNLKLAEEYTTYFIANGDSVPMMRVPSSEINSDASSYIVLLQTDLTSANTNYKGNLAVSDVSTLNTNLSNIISSDNDWIVEYYKTEIDFYKNYEVKRKKTADSLDAVTKKNAQIEQKRVADSIAKVNKEKELAMKEAQKAKTDSIAEANKYKGYKFVNVDELSLREQPSKTGKLIGTLGATSWVKILNEKEVDGYIYIKAGERQGYVYNSYLVETLDEITIEDADIETAKIKQTVIFEAATSTSTKKYLKDSKGNCYYTNSAGKKIMVDRSYCD